MYQGKFIRLRALERRDLKQSRTWVNDSEIASLVDRVLPVTEYDHKKWFQAIKSDKNIVFFAIESLPKRTYIGNIWLWNIDWRHRKAELRIIIGEKKAQGKGYGTEAIKVITSIAFHKLNLHKVYARVLSFNKRAKKAFTKAGFFVEATLKEDAFINGHYHDVYLMARINEI